MALPVLSIGLRTGPRIGPEGAVILESLRGDDAGTVIEYLGESGTVVGKATSADFGQLLAQ